MSSGHCAWTGWRQLGAVVHGAVVDEHTLIGRVAHHAAVHHGVSWRRWHALAGGVVVGWWIVEELVVNVGAHHGRIVGGNNVRWTADDAAAAAAAVDQMVVAGVQRVHVVQMVGIGIRRVGIGGRRYEMMELMVQVDIATSRRRSPARRPVWAHG